MDTARKILLCDVKADAWSDLKVALKAIDFDVCFASDATFALAMALKQRVSAVVLGPQLHAGGPLMAVRRIRASVHTTMLPIVAIVAPGADRQALLDAGASPCLLPPVDVPEVIAALKEQLGIARTTEKAPTEALLDPARLRALDETQMLDSAPEPSLDVVTQLAARILQVPVALVSLVDRERQFFKSQVGLPTPWNERRQTPLSHSFCQWVVSSREELVVADARTHPVLAGNGAVADLGVVAYAGVPLQSSEGLPLGAFCAIDGKPRHWTTNDLATLRDLAKIVDAHVALAIGDRAAERGGLSDAILRGTSRAAGQGFLGAARVLRRYAGLLDDERQVLLALVERHGQSLTVLTDQPLGAAA